MNKKTFDGILPYNYTPRNYQLPVLQKLDQGIKRVVLVWHRRAGKDKTILNYVVKYLYQNIGTAYYIFPTYAQGRKVLWDGIGKDGFKYIDHFPKELIRSKNESEMRIELDNGSAFQIIGADNTDRLMGTNPIICVFSEYSVQNPKAWEYLRPILTENGGTAIFIYTPRGMNHGWTLLEQVKNDPYWYCEVQTVESTKAIDLVALEQDKKGMPDDIFQQEYNCRFIEGAGQFFRNIDSCIYEGDIVPSMGRRYQLGCDLAKFQDYTVLTAIDLHTFKVAKQDSFNQMDYDLQKSKIEAFFYKWNRSTIRIDSSGVGEPVCDFLKGNVRLQQYVFTESSRTDLLANLQIKLEQRIIKIPNDPELIGQLKSFRYALHGERGKVRAEAPEGIHDDKVMSLALAVWDLPKDPLYLNPELRRRNGRRRPKFTGTPTYSLRMV